MIVSRGYGRAYGFDLISAIGAAVGGLTGQVTGAINQANQAWAQVETAKLNSDNIQAQLDAQSSAIRQQLAAQSQLLPFQLQTTKTLALAAGGVAALGILSWLAVKAFK